MERRRFFDKLARLVGGLCAGTLVFGSRAALAAGGAVTTAAGSRLQLPDWASATGRSLSTTDACANECGEQCAAMCESQCVGAMCSKMCGSECASMCAGQCDIMCGAGAVQLCLVAMCDEMCALENAVCVRMGCNDMCAVENVGCFVMSCKSGTSREVQYAMTALRTFEFRFNLAHISPQYLKYRPQLIEEFYDKFTKSSGRSKVFPELDSIRGTIHR